MNITLSKIISFPNASSSFVAALYVSEAFLLTRLTRGLPPLPWASPLKQRVRTTDRLAMTMLTVSSIPVRSRTKESKIGSYERVKDT
jgi:hypothetical protein